MEIKEAGPEDAEWIRAKLIESWGSTRMVLRGTLVEAMDCPALIAGEREGLLHYRRLTPKTLEIVTLEAFEQNRGIGTALVEAVVALGRRNGHRWVHVVTTNDNLDALRFYQLRGFAIHEVRIGAVTSARNLKPEIPLLGSYRIPLRDEIELVRAIA